MPWRDQLVMQVVACVRTRRNQQVSVASIRLKARLLPHVDQRHFLGNSRPSSKPVPALVSLLRLFGGDEDDKVPPHHSVAEVCTTDTPAEPPSATPVLRG
jgi:hypothetical protein